MASDDDIIKEIISVCVDHDGAHGLRKRCCVCRNARAFKQLRECSYCGGYACIDIFGCSDFCDQCDESNICRYCREKLEMSAKPNCPSCKKSGTQFPVVHCPKCIAGSRRCDADCECDEEYYFCDDHVDAHICKQCKKIICPESCNICDSGDHPIHEDCGCADPDCDEY